MDPKLSAPDSGVQGPELPRLRTATHQPPLCSPPPPAPLRAPPPSWGFLWLSPSSPLSPEGLLSPAPHTVALGQNCPPSQQPNQQVPLAPRHTLDLLTSHPLPASISLGVTAPPSHHLLLHSFSLPAARAVMLNFRLRSKMHTEKCTEHQCTHTPTR